MLSKITVVLGALFLLAGCATPDRNVPLSKSQSPLLNNATRRELRGKCFLEAGWDLRRVASALPYSIAHKFADSNTTVETRHLRSLCSKIFDAEQFESGNGSPAQYQNVLELCDQEIAEHSALGNAEVTAHLARFRRICDAGAN